MIHSFVKGKYFPFPPSSSKRSLKTRERGKILFHTIRLKPYINGWKKEKKEGPERFRSALHNKKNGHTVSSEHLQMQGQRVAESEPNALTAFRQSSIVSQMDLRGVEPLSESLAIATSPITVYLHACAIPSESADKRAFPISSFIIRPYGQSFPYVVSYEIDARVRMRRCTLSDSCH